VWHRKIQELEAKVHKHGVTVQDVADLEETLKRTIALKDVSGGDICDSGKYSRGSHRPISTTMATPGLKILLSTDEAGLDI